MDRETTPNAPLETFRDGRLKATVWANEGERGIYHTVTFAKTYEDKDGKLQETSSFTGSELLRVAELAREAHAFTRDLRCEMAVERKADRAEPAREARPKRIENYTPRRSEQ